MLKQYTEKDFKIRKNASTETPYGFISKDDNISANFIWRKGDVQIRALVGDMPSERLTIGFPFAGGIGKPPNPKEMLKTFVRHLNRDIREGKFEGK